MSAAVRLRSTHGRGVLFAVVLGSGIAFLDQTVVNVALPTIGRSLQMGMSGLQWTVDAYLLLLSALLLVGGSLGDRFGRRRIFSLGLVWFAIASAACGLAPTWQVLIAARALQGIGAALLVPGSLALLRSTFHPDDQAPAVGVWAGWSGVTSAVGPLLGGWLVEAISWRVIFLINLPLVVVALWAARRWLPESRDEEAPPVLDVLGAVTATLGLGGLTFALIEGAHAGFDRPMVLVALVVGVLGAVGFVFVESRCPNPMLPLRLFRVRRFTAANLTTLAVYFGLGGAAFLVVLELQLRLGYSPLAAGAALTPLTVLLLLLSPSAGRLARRIGPRLPMTIGPLLGGVGLLLLSRIAPGARYLSDVLPGMTVLGLGLAATVAPLTSTALEAVEPRFAGVASGVNNAVARTAGLFAVALLPLFGGVGRSGSELAPGGYATALRVAALACAAGGVIAFVLLGERRSDRTRPSWRVASPVR